MQAPTPGSPELATKKWGMLASVGAVAVVAGLLLPQLIPSQRTPPRPAVESNPTSTPLAYRGPEWPEPPSTQGMFLRLAIGTFIVLGLCVGTIHLCKKWNNQKPSSPTNQQLRLIETLALPRRCWVQLIQFNNHPVLIAGDASGVKSMVHLPESFTNALRESVNDQQGDMATILAQRFAANMDSPEPGTGRA